MSEATPIPVCPRCGAAMQLHRILSASFGYPELRTYACTQCREAVTEEAAAPPQPANRAQAG